jgi:hypothetical protein
MSNLRSVMQQCGKAQVNLAPLLIIMGAAVSAENGGEVAEMAEMLDLQLVSNAKDQDQEQPDAATA